MKEREANKEEVGKLKVVQALRELADKIESGENPLTDVNVEYVRANVPFAYEHIAPVIGRKFTFMLPGGEN